MYQIFKNSLIAQIKSICVRADHSSYISGDDDGNSAVTHLAFIYISTV